MNAGLKPLLAKVANGAALSHAEAEEAFGVIMAGEATPSQIGGFLMALRVRGETVDELAGAVCVMRANMLPVSAPAHAIDIVGTGGDHAGTLNISTCAAFVAAGCGLVIAKHGNRALSSRSGAGDVLSALGVRVDLTPAQIARTITEAGIGFMFAPLHHSAMRFVGPTRVELGTRTIFNLLGPLSNPASVRRMLVGVFSPEWLIPVAEALAQLGAESAWVVHGDGLDEMTTCGTTEVAALRNGRIETFTITPEDAGLTRAGLPDIRGGDGEANAAALRSVLAGARNAYRDIVLLNAAGALMMAGEVGDLRAGVARAARSIDDGRALAALERLVIASNVAEGATA